jgi:hypothetical protein
MSTSITLLGPSDPFFTLDTEAIEHLLALYAEGNLLAVEVTSELRRLFRDAWKCYFMKYLYGGPERQESLPMQNIPMPSKRDATAFTALSGFGMARTADGPLFYGVPPTIVENIPAPTPQQWAAAAERRREQDFADGGHYYENGNPRHLGLLAMDAACFDLGIFPDDPISDAIEGGFDQGLLDIQLGHEATTFDDPWANMAASLARTWARLGETR